MSTKNQVILFAIFIGLLNSCEFNKNDSDSETNQMIDVFGKFEIELPLNWHKEFNSTEFSAGIISSDTSKELSETIVINANWNLDTVNINSHLEDLMDSLNTTIGLETKIKKTGSINEYRTYFSYGYGLDSLTDLKLNQLLYILKSDSLKGHILLTARIYGDTLKNEHSKQVSQIVESIRMKK
jgi:hypothetical protein